VQRPPKIPVKLVLGRIPNQNIVSAFAII